MFRLLEEYHIMPRDYLAMDSRQQAFLVACCQAKDDAEKEAEKRAKRNK